jgi:hypothetical protein
MISIKTIGSVRGHVRGSAAVWLALALYACGGGGSAPPPPPADVTAPTATLSQTGADLNANATIVVRFSEAMNPSSLQLGGTLAADSNGSVWSKTNVDNDTLTLSPKAGGWTNGSGRTLTVNGKDLAGNALATVNASYAVNLAFDNFQPAAAVIGQSDFAGNQSNQGVVAGANTLNFPFASALVTPEGRLFVGDYANNRVLAYNSPPTANNTNADFVLGQPNFIATGAVATTQSSHNGPSQLATTVDGKLIVVDVDANRVVIYSAMPTSGTAVPDVVVGQPTFTSSGFACTAFALRAPEAVAVTPGGKLIVTDSGNNRVLIWDTIPTANGQAANVVLGQGDFTHCTANDLDQNGTVDVNTSAQTLSFPAAVWTDGTRLLVTDENNNRVLIWNQIPTANFQPANSVLGQSNFTNRAFNDDNQVGTPSVMTARTMRDPAGGITSNGVQLAVTDSGNNRVLIWNSFPTSNFQPADTILGQNAPDHAAPNDDNQDGTSETAASARTLAFPTGVLFYRDKLLVTDSENSRVLIFKSK